MLMNVQLTMNAMRTLSVQTQKVATRAVVSTVTREMERTVQVRKRLCGDLCCHTSSMFSSTPISYFTMGLLTNPPGLAKHFVARV